MLIPNRIISVGGDVRRPYRAQEEEFDWSPSDAHSPPQAISVDRHGRNEAAKPRCEGLRDVVDGRFV